ncbi:hypothetical protein DSO10_15315, partial [Listeria monocytogenes]|nr:hypothetical protein [Listeria monocytogenes]
SLNTLGVNNAKTQADAQNKANKQLVEANILKLVQANAEATVKSLVNLSEETQNQYISYINSSGTSNDVLVIQARANALNTILGLTEISKANKDSDLTVYLTDPRYWNYRGTTVEAVEAYEANVVKQNNDLMVAKELAKSIKTAQDAINALTGLTNSEKAAYSNQVASAVTDEEI